MLILCLLCCLTRLQIMVEAGMERLIVPSSSLAMVRQALQASSAFVQTAHQPAPIMAILPATRLADALPLVFPDHH